MAAMMEEEAEEAEEEEEGDLMTSVSFEHSQEKKKLHHNDL